MALGTTIHQQCKKSSDNPSIHVILACKPLDDKSMAPKTPKGASAKQKPKEEQREDTLQAVVGVSVADDIRP